jgi:uncharacterized membrane protein
MTETTSSRPAVAGITEQEKQDGKVMSIIAYLGILVFIPMLTSKNNKYVMYHTEQGLALFISWIAVWIIFIILDPILRDIIHFGYFCGGSLIYGLIRLGLFVLMILGIINAAQGKVAPLPVIGQFGEKFNLVK